MTGDQIVYLVYLIPVVMIASSVFWVLWTIRMGRGKMKIGLTIVGCVVVIVLSFLLVNVILQRNNEGTDVVKNAHPSSIPTITYGQAIDAYCTDTSWSMFKADGKTGEKQETVVEINGNAVYESKESDIKIQFTMSETSRKLDGSFYVSYIEVDGNNLSQENQMNLLYLMFQKYASENRISLDEETAKVGILASQIGSESIQENSSQSSTNVELIKRATPSDYTTEMTYGDAFDSFFSNTTWSPYGDDGTMVEFTGIFTFGREECRVDIIFTIEKDGSFDASALTFAGVEQNYEEWLNLRKAVFDYYEESINSGESGY